MEPTRETLEADIRHLIQRAEAAEKRVAELVGQIALVQTRGEQRIRAALRDHDARKEARGSSVYTLAREVEALEAALAAVRDFRDETQGSRGQFSAEVEAHLLATVTALGAILDGEPGGTDGS